MALFFFQARPISPLIPDFTRKRASPFQAQHTKIKDYHRLPSTGRRGAKRNAPISNPFVTYSASSIFGGVRRRQETSPDLVDTPDRQVSSWSFQATIRRNPAKRCWEER
jgi:hypothetical protein